MSECPDFSRCSVRIYPLTYIQMSECPDFSGCSVRIYPLTYIQMSECPDFSGCSVRIYLSTYTKITLTRLLFTIINLFSISYVHSLQ